MIAAETKLPPVRLSVTVPLSQARAFALFTENIDTWWPLDRFRVSGDAVDRCFVEPRSGGRVYETTKEGEQKTWGEVLVFEPPRRIVLSWHPGGNEATVLEINFVPADPGTLVELEHRGWEVFADRAAESRSGYEEGWALVLGQRFAAAARAAGEKEENPAR